MRPLLREKELGLDDHFFSGKEHAFAKREKIHYILITSLSLLAVVSLAFNFVHLLGHVWKNVNNKTAISLSRYLELTVRS